MLLVAGITNTFPVFLPALLADFGGSRAATSATASLLWIGGALLSPIAGYLVAHWNPRRLVCLGLAIVAGGMLIGSAVPTLPLFLLAMGVGGGIGLGLTGMTTHAALIGDADVRRRGLATGIAFGGSMAAYALAPPAQWIITHWGWRPAFWCYAAAILALIPWAWRAHPTRLASVRSGGAPGSAAVTLRSIVRSAGFWSLLVMFTIPPLFGYLATTQHALYFGYVFFLFLPLGSRASIVTELLSRIAPPAHYGVIFGLLGIGNNLRAAVGPWLSGLLFDRTGAYLAIYLCALGVALTGLTALSIFCFVTRAAPAARPA